MARPRKQGLEYFPFECDFFADERMVAIAGEFGLKGEIITVHLLCAVYRNGYFVEWGDLMKFKLLKELPGVSAELLEQVVSRLVRWGFFDEGLFNSDGVLTSKDIQQAYFNVSRKRVGTVEFPHFLDFRGRNHGLTGVSAEETGVSAAETPQSKGNYIKKPTYVGKESPPPSPPSGMENFQADESLGVKNQIFAEKGAFCGNENRDAVKVTSGMEETQQNALNSGENFSKKIPAGAAAFPARNLRRTFDENVRDCLNSPQWQEMVQITIGIREIDWLDAFEKFRANLVANGHETEKSLQDFKQHFSNWLRIKKQQNENGKRAEKMGGNEPKGGRTGVGRAEIAPAAVVPSGRGKSVV